MEIENIKLEDIDKIIDERWKYYSAGLTEKFKHETSPKTIELLEKLTEKLDNKVYMKLDKKLFFWVIGILIIVLSGIIGRLTSISILQNNNYIEIVQRLTSIETKMDLIYENKK